MSSNAALDMCFWFADIIPRSKTHPQKRVDFDLGLAISRKVFSCFYSKNRALSYSPLDDENSTEMEAVPFMKLDDADAEDLNKSDDECDDGEGGKKESRLPTPVPEKSRVRPILPLRRIFTQRFVLMLMVSAIHDSHISAYTILWVNFLSDPPATGAHDSLPFRFSGGPGMTPSEIGLTLSIVGICGLPIQFFVYPKVIHKLGALRAWRLFMRGLPVIYSVAPFIAVVSKLTRSSTSEQGQPPAVWMLIAAIQVTLIFCAAFVTPTALMLVRL